MKYWSRKTEIVLSNNLCFNYDNNNNNNNKDFAVYNDKFMDIYHANNEA